MGSRSQHLKKLAAVLVLGGLYAGGTYAADTTKDDAKIVQGKELYDDFGCYACHGHVGQGSGGIPPAGPKLAPDPMPFVAFKAMVRKPVRNMPPYSEKVLSDDQIEKIYAYVQSIKN